MPPKVISGSPMANICIFWGPNYLLHTATNTSACMCIALFCNTFLPSLGRQFKTMCNSSFEAHSQAHPTMNYGCKHTCNYGKFVILII